MDIRIGDEFMVKKLPYEEHMQLSINYGGWTSGMRSFIGKIGKVCSLDQELHGRNVLRLSFEAENGSLRYFVFNPNAVERIRSDEDYDLY